MKRNAFIASLAGFAALFGGAGIVNASPSPAPKEASIPFVNHGGIYNWRVIDRDTVLIQDVHRRWYRAELMTSCFDLNFAERIGFETRGSDTFDRFSTIIVRGQRCPLKSLVASPPPPKKVKKAKDRTI